MTFTFFISFVFLIVDTLSHFGTSIIIIFLEPLNLFHTHSIVNSVYVIFLKIVVLNNLAVFILRYIGIDQ